MLLEREANFRWGQGLYSTYLLISTNSIMYRTKLREKA